MRDKGQPQPPTLAQAPVRADTQIAGGFGNYVFFGGLHFPSTQTTVSVNPGRYVRAGALSGTPMFYMHNGVTLTDQTSLDANGIAQPNSDVGATLPGNLKDFAPTVVWMDQRNSNILYPGFPYYWLLLAESHLTRRLFGSLVRRIEALPVSAG